MPGGVYSASMHRIGLGIEYKYAVNSLVAVAEPGRG